MLVLAVPSVVAGLLALRLPETAGMALPETYGEAMELDVSGGEGGKRKNYSQFGNLEVAADGATASVHI
jgi:hypothetical protein